MLIVKLSLYHSLTVLAGVGHYPQIISFQRVDRRGFTVKTLYPFDVGFAALCSPKKCV